MRKDTDVLVIGGGPAGLLAAIRAARLGAGVILVEKNKVLAKKLRITGKGRCNLTNTVELEVFVRQYGGQGRFLHSAFSRFFWQDICRLLDEAGVETKEERGGRVFPLSDKADDVADALERLAVQAGAGILRGCKVSALLYASEGTEQEDAAQDSMEPRDATTAYTEPRGTASDDGQKARVVGAEIYDPWDHAEIRAKAVIVATGGLSYPLTGSTGDGYTWARAAGHNVTALYPALVPLTSPDPWVGELAGLTLKNVGVSLWANEQRVAAYQGEMLFAHFGLTGPVVLSLSRHVHKATGRIWVQIDLKPALTPEVLDKRLVRDFTKYQKKQLVNAMTELLPRALIPAVIAGAGLAENQPVAELTRAQRQALVRTLKALPVEISGTRPMDEAIVTAGGVALPEIYPGTMASKKTAGLYFAGELLDIDGLTGGYNLQAAFSTGWTAGESAAKEAGFES